MIRPVLAAAVGLAVAVSLVAPAEAADEPAADVLAVLVYSHTTVFRHDSIPAGIAAIGQLGDEHGFRVDATEDPAVFTPQGLAPYDVVVFLNTTGEVMADDAARAAFEDHIRGGAGWVGIHAAADTEYDWEFYSELLGGAYFLTHPLVNQPGTLDVEAHDHPSVAHLPDRWSLPSEEYYSFTENPRGRVRVLMTIDGSSYVPVPNTATLGFTPFVETEASPLETGRMGDHPMSWCRDVDAGRAWYTAIGHEAGLYDRDDYRVHLAGGILTAAGVLDADCAVAASPPPDADDGTPTAGDGTDAEDDARGDADDDRGSAHDEVRGGSAPGAAEDLTPAPAGEDLPVTGRGLLPVSGSCCSVSAPPSVAAAGCGDRATGRVGPSRRVALLHSEPDRAPEVT